METAAQRGERNSEPGRDPRRGIARVWEKESKKRKYGKKNTKIEVQEEVYKALDRFELDDIKEMNEYDRHIEHSEIYEDNLCVRAMDKPTGLEDYIIQKSTFEDLKKAINMLPEVQKRRIKNSR